MEEQEFTSNCDLASAEQEASGYTYNELHKYLKTMDRKTSDC